MPDLKITYFDFPGRAEAARLALTIASIPFEDERLLPLEFLDRQPSLPYASLPVLTVDGVVYAQSAAILRYCAKIAGLYPQHPLLAQRADEVVDVILDFISGLEAVTTEANADSHLDSDHDTDHDTDLHSADNDNDEDDDAGLHQIRLLKYVNEAVPKFLGGLEHRLKLFGPGPWAVADSLTSADLAIYVCILNINAGAFDHMSMRPMQAYKRIMASFEAVRDHPKVAAWNDDIARKADLVRQAVVEEHKHDA